MFLINLVSDCTIYSKFSFIKLAINYLMDGQLIRLGRESEISLFVGVFIIDTGANKHLYHHNGMYSHEQSKRNVLEHDIYTLKRS